MKKIILTLALTILINSVALGESCIDEQADEIIIGVTDTSMVNNTALEWFLLNNKICNSIRYTKVDLSQWQEANVDLLILADTDYSYAIQTNKLFDLSSFISQEDFIINYSTELLTANEIEMKLYGVPRSIGQEFLFWDEVVANALEISKPEVSWTWADACRILETIMSANNPNLYGMYGMSHEYISGFRSEMFDTLLEFFANSGRIDDELVRFTMQLFKRIYLTDALLSDYPQNNDMILLQDVGLANQEDYEFLIHNLLMPLPLISKKLPNRMGHYTYYCMPEKARSIERSKKLIKLILSQAYLSVTEQNVTFWISNSMPSNLVGLHCTNIICTEDGFLRVVNSEDIRSYYVTPFQNQEAYVWYASANRMCLPSKNITNYNYYQNMLRVLAYFCKNQMSIDSAQALITALFAEVIHCE